MDEKTRSLIRNYVNSHIDSFHTARIKALKNLRLKRVLRSKNPYLFKAKNLNRAADLVAAILDARLSSSEEGAFGNFMEHLAVYIVEQRQV
ncbi:MAG TPA: PmeII family type II restriction endonuclease [Terriglobia bacterium]|nr:PmeII family type II restriction endonuclease [Terriglobia bacterium]